MYSRKHSTSRNQILNKVNSGGTYVQRTEQEAARDIHAWCPCSMKQVDTTRYSSIILRSQTTVNSNSILRRVDAEFSKRHKENRMVSFFPGMKI